MSDLQWILPTKLKSNSSEVNHENYCCHIRISKRTYAVYATSYQRQCRCIDVDWTLHNRHYVIFVLIRRCINATCNAGYISCMFQFQSLIMFCFIFSCWALSIGDKEWILYAPNLLCLCVRFFSMTLYINILFANCKGGNFNIHIWVWFGYFIC